MEIALVVAFFAAWAGWAVAGFALIDRRYYKRISEIHKDSARFWEGQAKRYRKYWLEGRKNEPLD